MRSENKGIIWSGVQAVTVRGTGLIFSMWIARLVTPEAYGLIAMISVFIAFFQLFVDSGLGNALIQKNDKQDIDFHTIFIANLAISLIIYGCLFALAPLISQFYRQPELTPLVRWASLVLIIQAFTIVHKSKLNIELNFKAQAYAGILSTVCGGSTGLFLAYRGYGVWALVVQTLTSQTVLSISLLIFGRWRPQLMFSKSSFRVLFRYGSKDLIGNIFTSFYIQAVNLVIGKFYTPASLAFYNRGFNLGLLPAGLMQETFARISFPVMCKSQNNINELASVLYKYERICAFGSFTFAGLFIGIADPLIRLILTDRWEGAVVFTQVFSLAFSIFPLMACVGQIINAAGFPGVNMKVGFIKRGISFAILAGTVWISPLAIAWGIVAGNVIELLISMFLVRRVMKIGIRNQIAPIIKSLILGITILVTVYLSSQFASTNLLKITIGLAATALTMIVVMKLLRMDEIKSLKLIIQKIQKHG